jgi:hypothetical protein
MAGVGIGAFDGLRPAMRSFVQFDNDFSPDPGTAARHAARFETYKLAYEQLKPLRQPAGR